MTLLRLQDLPLVRSRRLGRMPIHAIEAGLQRLDGGAMFGVVPRPLWERRVPPDERHRILLALRCLLVEAPGALILVDTGIGTKESDRFRDLYGVEDDGRPSRLEEGIRQAGFEPGDVELVISTHLHFDHAGGNTWLASDGTVHPTFPSASYVVQKGELRFARERNERIRASYPEWNFDPIAEEGLWDLVEGDTVLTEGVRLIHTPGHTPHHQSVLLESDGERALFLADLCPTAAHLPLPWVMGYDVEPLVTMETKRRMWSLARRESWLLIFEHDVSVPWGRLEAESERPQLLREVP